MPAAREGWNFSCPDWEDRLRAGDSLVPDLPLDKKEAARAIAIFNRLRLPDVPGCPTLEESGGDWVRDLLGPLCGSIDQDGVRHVGEFLAMVPKKNIKTTGGAGIMLTVMLAEDPKRSANQQFHLYGPTQPIAELAYFQALGMIRADPEGYLQKRFHPREHLRSIVDLATNNELRVKTFDMKVSTGTIPKGVLVDELHILGAMAFAERVIGQIRGGLITRRDSFLGFITTQADQAPAGAFKAELQLARRIRDGKASGKAARMLPLLYEFPEAMQAAREAWEDPANWHMVNPNLGHSVSVDRLEADWAQAKEKGEGEMRRWASQHLNVQIGLGLHDQRWRGADYWEGAADAEACGTLDGVLSRCEVVVAAADGGGLDDLFGFAVAGREKGTDRWLFWSHAWAVRSVLEIRKEIAPALLDFEKDGDLTFVGRASEIIAAVVALTEQVMASGLLPEKAGFGVDPFGIGALIDALDGIGLTEPQVWPLGQGSKLSSAIWSMEFKLSDGMLAHSGSPMMAWCVGNAKAVQRGDAVLITKETAGKSKIDPLVAMFMTGKLLEANPVAAKGKADAGKWIESLRSAA